MVSLALPAMVLALAIAFLSVALGVALGLGRTVARVALGPVRTFALLAAVATVALELVPGAVERGGLAPLGAFALAATAPWLLERFGGRWGEHRSPAMRLEAAYVALLVHHVGDGLGLGAFTDQAHQGHTHWDVLLSIGAHTVPVTAVVVLAFSRRASRGAAAMRGLAFGLAIAAGIGLERVVSPEAFEHVEPIVTGAVAGLLLHVAAHDWLEDPPVSRTSRLLDLVGAGLGVALVVASLGAHEHHAGQASHGEVSVAASAVSLAMRFSPPLLAAAVLGALLGRSRQPQVARTGGMLAALRGAVLGATTGEGSAVATSAGALDAASTLAFALAAGGLGLSTLALSANAFGPPFAGAWLVLSAVGVASLAWLARRGAPPSRTSVPPAQPRGFGAHRWFDAVEGAFATAAAPAAIGVVVAAALGLMLRDGALAPLSHRRLDVLVLPLLALALRAPPVALVAPLLVLVDKGANAPAALAALAVTSAAPRRVLARAPVSRVALGALVLGMAAVALALTFVGWPPSPVRTRPSTEVSPIDALCAAVLAALALAGAWQRGVRPFIAVGLGRGTHHHGPCFEESAGDGHDHAHAPTEGAAAREEPNGEPSSGRPSGEPSGKSGAAGPAG